MYIYMFMYYVREEVEVGKVCEGVLGWEGIIIRW